MKGKTLPDIDILDVKPPSRREQEIESQNANDRTHAENVSNALSIGARLPDEEKRGGRIKKHGGKVRGDLQKPRLDKRARGGGIHIKPSHKGLLHKELGVPQGKKIPQAKLEAAKHSSNPAERKRATFAENFGHASGGKVKLGAARSPFDKD